MQAVSVIRFLLLRNASELRLVPGEPPRVVAQDGIRALDLPPLDWRALDEVLHPFLDEDQWREYKRTGMFERVMGWRNPDGRFRVSVSQNGLCFVWEKHV